MDYFHSEAFERLFTAFSLMNTKEDCAAFLQDLCTITELQDMAQRLETASKQVGVSTTTISRVSRCLNYGAGGYGKALEKLQEGQAQDEA